MKRKKPLKSGKKLKSQPTGEGQFLDSVLEEREHTSYISGLNIEGGRANCAHVLPKGKYPEWKYDPDNIVLLTWKEHQLFDQGTENDRHEYKLRMLARGVEVDWDILFDLKETLHDGS